MSNPLLSFEHRVLRQIRAVAPGRRYLVATSGGIDSMVLAEVLRRWRAALSDRLVIAHVHHGEGPPHRAVARDLVRAWAREHQLPFVSNPPPRPAPRGEAAAREFRYAQFARWCARYELDVTVLAHHRDDQVETRLLRLIRGTGPGGLAAMPIYHAGRLRPLLGVSRAEVKAYARGRGLRWAEDPSNADPSANLRAWLRNEWLPALETRIPGSTGALARSLELAGRPGVAIDAPGERLRRAAFRAATVDARAAAVVAEFKALGVCDFGRTQVLEVVKRLASERKEFSFDVAGVTFHVGAHVWWASRVCD